MDRVEISPNIELTFDGRILTFSQRWEKRSYTEKFDVGLAKWQLTDYTTLFKRRKQLHFSISTPGSHGGGQTVIAEGAQAEALRAFVHRAFGE